MPENEDLMSLKKSSQTVMQSHFWLVQKEMFWLSKYAGQRSLSHSKHILDKIRTPKERPEAEPCFRKISIYLFLRIVISFQFVEIHLCVDLYAIFRTQSTHVFFLAIGKLMKECLVDLLEDTEPVSIAIKFGQNVANSYWKIKKRVRHCFNAFSKNAEYTPSCSKGRIDFKRRKRDRT